MTRGLIVHNLYWIAPLFILEAILKLITLWRSAQRKQLYWFIAIFILNTAGILPIIYLLIYRDTKSSKKR